MCRWKALLVFAVTVVFAITGCGGPAQQEAAADRDWAVKRFVVDSGYGIALTAYGLCQAQALTGTTPDGMDEAKFAANVAKADVAFTTVGTAYILAQDAVGKRDTAAYTAAALQLATATAAILQVKAAICPLKDNGKETSSYLPDSPRGGSAAPALCHPLLQGEFDGTRSRRRPLQPYPHKGAKPRACSGLHRGGGPSAPGFGLTWQRAERC